MSPPAPRCARLSWTQPSCPALPPSGWSWLGSWGAPPTPQQCRPGQSGQLGRAPGSPAVRKPRPSHPNMSWCCHPPGITGSAELRAAVSGRKRGWGHPGGTVLGTAGPGTPVLSRAGLSWRFLERSLARGARATDRVSASGMGSGVLGSEGLAQPAVRAKSHAVHPFPR